MLVYISNKKKPLDGFIIVLVLFTFYSVYWAELIRYNKAQKKPSQWKALINLV